jgi:hypothetical protein
MVVVIDLLLVFKERHPAAHQSLVLSEEVLSTGR